MPKCSTSRTLAGPRGRLSGIERRLRGPGNLEPLARWRACVWNCSPPARCGTRLARQPTSRDASLDALQATNLDRIKACSTAYRSRLRGLASRVRRILSQSGAVARDRWGLRMGLRVARVSTASPRPSWISVAGHSQVSTERAPTGSAVVSAGSRVARHTLANHALLARIATVLRWESQKGRAAPSKLRRLRGARHGRGKRSSGHQRPGRQLR